jgi:hypothetical protein
MTGKFKKITSSLLLLIFLLPSVVKLEHHHDSFICKAIDEKHYHVVHQTCAICNFEFSVFLTDIENIDLPKGNPLDNYSNNYNSRYNYNLSQFSFLLRAPPDKQI